MDTLTTANPRAILEFVHPIQKYRTDTGVLGFKGSVLKETEKAVQFQIGKGQVWFPRSAIDIGQNTVHIKKWFKYNDEQWKIIEPESVFFS